MRNTPRPPLRRQCKDNRPMAYHQQREANTLNIRNNLWNKWIYWYKHL